VKGVRGGGTEFCRMESYKRLFDALERRLRSAVDGRGFQQLGALLKLRRTMENC
jgi:hypothetical protein